MTLVGARTSRAHASVVPALLAHLRAEARRRWPAWLGVVLLTGVVGGLVLGSLAGARRTASAFDRMVDATESADVLVNPDEGAFSALHVPDVAALPGVVRIGVVDGGGGVVVAADGSLDGAAQVFVQRDPTAMVDFDRPRIVDGRLFDPRDPSEVMVTDTVAERHDVSAGDTLTIGTLTLDELDAWEREGADGPPPLTLHELTVSAVTVGVDEVVADELYGYGQVLLTHAFGVEHEMASFYYGIAVDLNDAAAVPEFRAAVGALVPDEAFEFKTLAATRETVERGLRPHAVALLAFVALIGLAGSVVCGQATTRQVLPLLNDAPKLQAMGISGRSLRVAGLARASAVAVPGAVLAALVAVAVSPLFPLGVGRRAEVSPGFSVDLVVLVPGSIVLAGALVAWTAVSLRRLRRGPARSRRVVGVVEALARSTSWPVVSTGLRAAVASPHGRSVASPRAAIAGLSVAVGVVAAALTFGSSLMHLVNDPAAYGWPWDAVIAPPGDDDHGPIIRARIEAAPEFSGSMVLSADQVNIGGERIPAVGMPTGEDGPGPTVVAGRLPGAPDELALGGRTMLLLDVSIGDRIEVGVGPDAELLEVVGQAVFPGLGTYSGADRTELGKGALLDREVLRQLGEGFEAEFVAIRADDPSDTAAGLARVTDGFEAAVEEGELEILDRPQRPSDVRSLASVRRTPEVIASVLAVLAGVALSVVLTTGARSRRRELALLKTFGFGSRAVAGTVLCQSSVTALLALVVGLPVGVVVGRLSWTALAEALGVAPDPHVPAVLVLVAIGTVLLANIVAMVPGVIAARTRAADLLRAE